jgi:DNA invertase Pin-like site-specific DNA recombinase
MTKYAALYCRISKDRTGLVEGVRAQERWGHTYAADHWPDLPVRVFADNDISAANGAVRPGYLALREALRQGEVAHLWCVEQSRLERTEIGWFELAAELDSAGITEVHTNRDGIVRARDEVAGIKAVLAAGEVRRMRQRVNDRLAENAAEGRPAGADVFGYRRGTDESGKKTLVIVPGQAKVLRECADRVLSGWSLTRIAADLMGRGVRGVRGGKLTQASIRQWMSNPTIAGQRVHQGQIVGRGVWEPILDLETWHSVRDRLSRPRRVDTGNGGTYPVPVGQRRGTGRRYLLTGGTAVCGVCGSALVAAMKKMHRRHEKPYYLCRPVDAAGSYIRGRACVGVVADELERHVVAELLAELDKPAFRDALTDDEHAARRDGIATALRKVDVDRAALAEMWGAGELNADEWRTARQGLADRELRLRAELAEVPPAVSHVDLDAIRAGWDSMTLDEQREIVHMFIGRVVVNRRVRRGRTFDPERVVVEWR